MPLMAQRISAGLPRLVGIEPLVGRGFLEEEFVPGQDRVVLLGHDLWQRSFGADEQVVGRQIRLDGVETTVVGVMPPEFELIDPMVDLFVPLAFDRDQAPRDRGAVMVLGRLARGATEASVADELRGLALRLEQEHPEANRDLAFHVVSVREQMVPSELRSLFGLIQATVLFVLLIACANIANLLLAQGQTPQRGDGDEASARSDAWRSGPPAAA